MLILRRHWWSEVSEQRKSIPFPPRRICRSFASFSSWLCWRRRATWSVLWGTVGDVQQCDSPGQPWLSAFLRSAYTLRTYSPSTYSSVCGLEEAFVEDYLTPSLTQVQITWLICHEGFSKLIYRDRSKLHYVRQLLLKQRAGHACLHMQIGLFAAHEKLRIRTVWICVLFYFLLSYED